MEEGTVDTEIGAETVIEEGATTVKLAQPLGETLAEQGTRDAVENGAVCSEAEESTFYRGGSDVKLTPRDLRLDEMVMSKIRMDFRSGPTSINWEGEYLTE